MELDGVRDKNIGIFLNYVAASPAPELFASAAELIQKHNKITFYYCDEELSGCSYNPIKSKSLCASCKSNVVQLKKLFGDVEFKKIKFSGVNTQINDSVARSFSLAAMSSVASLTKAVNEASLNKFWKTKLSHFTRDATDLYGYFTREVRLKKLDMLLCFNGRFFDAKPIVRAATDTCIDYCIVEVKKSIHPLAFVNELIHSADANCRRAEAHFETNRSLGKEQAKDFFERKINQESTGDPIYTKRQSKGSLPSYIAKNEKKLVVVFPTTDDEYKFIGSEWDGHVPDDQVHEIELLCTNLEDYLIVVKMHPNQRHMPAQSLQSYFALEKKFANCLVEAPKSKHDTYAFMQVADVVINFASTIGIEAAYFGKKVINIGDTNFTKLGAMPVCYTGKAAAELITSDRIPLPDKTAAMKWGNYLLSYRSNLTSFEYNQSGYQFKGLKFPNSQLKLRLIIPKLIIRVLKSKLLNR